MKASLTAELAKTVEARLKVFDTIHDNIFIDINGAKKLTDGALTGVIFTEHGGELVAAGL